MDFQNLIASIISTPYLIVIAKYNITETIITNPILLFFFAQYPLGKFAFTWNKISVKLMAKIRYIRFKNKKTIQLKELETLYNQIVETVISAK